MYFISMGAFLAAGLVNVIGTVSSIVEQYPDFSTRVRFEDIPAYVVDEARRLALDSTGCIFAAANHPGGTLALNTAD